MPIILNPVNPWVYKGELRSVKIGSWCHLSYTYSGGYGCAGLIYVWYLIYAIKIQVNQAGLILMCRENSLLLCSADKNQGCIDTSLCKSENETQGNKSTDPFQSLRDILCNNHFSNCSVTNNGNYLCNLEEHQNNTALFKFPDCWEKNIKETHLNSEIIFSLIVLLSVITMFLSYLCLQKTLKQSVNRKQTILLHCNEPERIELGLHEVKTL